MVLVKVGETIIKINGWTDVVGYLKLQGAERRWDRFYTCRVNNIGCISPPGWYGSSGRLRLKIRIIFIIRYRLKPCRCVIDTWTLSIKTSTIGVVDDYLLNLLTGISFLEFGPEAWSSTQETGYYLGAGVK